jgi:hypothetical protein
MGLVAIVGKPKAAAKKVRRSEAMSPLHARLLGDLERALQERI